MKSTERNTESQGKCEKSPPVVTVPMLRVSISYVDSMISQGLSAATVASGNHVILAIAVHNLLQQVHQLHEDQSRRLDIEVYTQLYIPSLFPQVQDWLNRVGEDMKHLSKQDEVDHTSRILEIARHIHQNEDSHYDQYMSSSTEEVLNTIYHDLQELSAVADQLQQLPQTSPQLGTAMQTFLEPRLQHRGIDEEKRNYRRFRTNHVLTPKRLFVYLLSRLKSLAGDLPFLKFSRSEADDLIKAFEDKYFPREVLFPSNDLVAEDLAPLADEPLIAKLLHHIDLTVTGRFPVINPIPAVDYLTNHDFRACPDALSNICRLFTLLNVMQDDFSRHLESGLDVAKLMTDTTVDSNMELLERCNARLAPFLTPGHTIKQLNDLFRRWLREGGSTPEGRILRSKLNSKVFKEGKISLRYYLSLVHVAADHYGLVRRKDYMAIRTALEPEQEHFSSRRNAKYPDGSSFNKYLSDSRPKDDDWDEIEPYLKSE